MSTEASTENTSSFCTFKAGGRLFCANILDVKEINTELEFTPIHHAPEEVEGYVNIRGQIHLVLNLKKILRIDTETEDSNPRLVLFKENVGPDFGILVDQIGDIVEVNHNQIEDRRKGSTPPPDSVERRTPNIGIGVCKLKDNLMVVLNAKNLLQQINIQEDS